MSTVGIVREGWVRVTPVCPRQGHRGTRGGRVEEADGGAGGEEVKVCCPVWEQRLVRQNVSSHSRPSGRECG